MRSSTTLDAPVAVIGAGPHGLAAVAHLRRAGIPAVAFGETLEFWRETMPAGMRLRSPRRASSISSPDAALSLDRWGEDRGREVLENMPLEDFVDYGSWFAEHAIADLDSRRVKQIERENGHFRLSLSDGETMMTGRVVVAAGLGPFASIPPPFRELHDSLVSHASACAPRGSFAGKYVAVIGGGQSALEGAALLLEAGAAQVELIVRAPAIYWLNHGWLGVKDSELLPPEGPGEPPSWRARKGLYWHGAPTDIGGRFTSWLGAAPDLIRHFPRRVRTPLTYHCIRPAGAPWLPDRLRGAKLTLARSVMSATVEGERLRLRLDDDSERVVDHVLLGTGYEIDVERYSFIGPRIGSQLQVRQGYPVLGRGLESSIPGLHFLGAAAAESFRPTMRFVVGTAYTAPALAQYVTGRRGPIFRWAF
jgi:cation diffusion facilitator CzcD-associated flavoprotein CzcO